jgi:hypothetical protein
MTRELVKYGQVWSNMVKDGQKNMVKKHGQKKHGQNTWSVHSQKKSIKGTPYDTNNQKAAALRYKIR